MVKLAKIKYNTMRHRSQRKLDAFYLSRHRYKKKVCKKHNLIYFSDKCPYCMEELQDKKKIPKRRTI